MTAVEKAKETRRQHQEAQRAKWKEQIQIRDQLKKSCREILDDVKATAAEKTKAAEILFSLSKGW